MGKALLVNSVQVSCHTRCFGLLVAAVGVSTSPVALAQESKLSACLSIPDVNVRVACYDAIARDERGAEGTGSERPATANASAAPEPIRTAGPAPQTEFGLSAAERDERRPAEQQQLEQLALRVVSARAVGPGYWRFSMDDGSTWQLTEVRRAFRAPTSGAHAVIRRGSLGSYFLDVDGQPGIRIKRLN
jgi:hypothetical protein